MVYVQTLFFVLAFTSLNYVQSNKVCTLTDTECTTKAFQRLLVKLVPGVPSLFGPLDPLVLPYNEAIHLNLNYKVTNASLTGMGNCLFDVFKVNPDDSTHYSEIQCPKLLLKYYYDVKGVLGRVETDGKGWAYITLNDYTLVIKGTYRQFISEKDQKLHFTFVSYIPTYKPNGPVTIDVDGILHSDPVKDALAREYTTKTGVAEEEEILRVTLWPQFLSVIMKNVGTYLEDVEPFDEVFQQ